jgi:hypothetical protein
MGYVVDLLCTTVLRSTREQVVHPTTGTRVDNKANATSATVLLLPFSTEKEEPAQVVRRTGAAPRMYSPVEDWRW